MLSLVDKPADIASLRKGDGERGISSSRMLNFDGSNSQGGSGLIAPLLVSIEGNIGAGKSTLLDKLRNANPSWIFIDEPVSTWSTLKNDAGESILEVFYQDRKRWSYTFQNCALLTRFQNIESAIRESGVVNSAGQRQVYITERCLETDYHVFTKMLRAEGSIDKLEFDLYERWFTQLKKSCTPLSAIVHVDTTPEVCSQRIKKRGRDGEGDIPLEYLVSLDKYQSQWVNAGEVPFMRTKLTDVEGSADVQRFVRGLLETASPLLPSSAISSSSWR